MYLGRVGRVTGWLAPDRMIGKKGSENPGNPINRKEVEDSRRPGKLQKNLRHYFFYNSVGAYQLKVNCWFGLLVCNPGIPL